MLIFWECEECGFEMPGARLDPPKCECPVCTKQLKIINDEVPFDLPEVYPGKKVVSSDYPNFFHPNQPVIINSGKEGNSVERNYREHGTAEAMRCMSIHAATSDEKPRDMFGR